MLHLLAEVALFIDYFNAISIISKPETLIRVCMADLVATRKFFASMPKVFTRDGTFKLRHRRFQKGFRFNITYITEHSKNVAL